MANGVHEHPVFDMDKHFIIDSVTRAVKNANEVKNRLFRGDHNSAEYLDFMG